MDIMARDEWILWQEMNAIIYGNLQEMWPLFVPYDNKEEHGY